VKQLVMNYGAFVTSLATVLLTEVLQSLSHIRRRADCLSTAKVIKRLIFQSLCHRWTTGVSPLKWL
jgi:DNA polymerase III psi subunit